MVEETNQILLAETRRSRRGNSRVKIKTIWDSYEGLGKSSKIVPSNSYIRYVFIAYFLELCYRVKKSVMGSKKAKLELKKKAWSYENLLLMPGNRFKFYYDLLIGLGLLYNLFTIPIKFPIYNPQTHFLRSFMFSEHR